MQTETLTLLGISTSHSGTFAGEWTETDRSSLAVHSPIDGSLLAQVGITTDEGYERVLAAAQASSHLVRLLPAPKRGEMVRQIGDELRKHKTALGRLIALEAGKIIPEAEGEVQEAIDICDFAVGLSRQLCGSTMHSERPLHRMYEQWHPLGTIGVITAFNFPLAVWAWNAIIAAVCGNAVVWKPSERTPLTAIATLNICQAVTKRFSIPALFTMVNGTGPSLGQQLAADNRLPLISATGSCAMGRAVAQTVAGRLGRSLLELGGNNAVTVLEDADINLAVRAVVFGAVGTAGQRCTTTRRLLLSRSIAPKFTERLIAAYKQIRIGDPLEPTTLMGPLIGAHSVAAYQHALARVPAEGGKVLYGGQVLEGYPSPFYVQPTIVEAHRGMALVREETFAPILSIIPIDTLDEAIAINNEVSQGLSSAIFTNNLRAAERYLSATGSDCGIANVNIGTSGAEIGGAFGGEKETGGGREAGSDCWKSYMRRQTNTINWGTELPLAQGIVFG